MSLSNLGFFISTCSVATTFALVRFCDLFQFSLITRPRSALNCVFYILVRSSLSTPQLGLALVFFFALVRLILPHLQYRNFPLSLRQVFFKSKHNVGPRSEVTFLTRDSLLGIVTTIEQEMWYCFGTATLAKRGGRDFQFDKVIIQRSNSSQNLHGEGRNRALEEGVRNWN